MLQRGDLAEIKKNISVHSYFFVNQRIPKQFFLCGVYFAGVGDEEKSTVQLATDCNA